MKITPCCKSIHWHSVVNFEMPQGVIRCEICDTINDFENLITVVNRLNPLTYYCDKCHKSALEERNESLSYYPGT